MDRARRRSAQLIQHWNRVLGSSWFETRGVAALLTVRVQGLVVRECEAIRPVSRTRCSVLHDAPQSRDPRLWCGAMDPGSAAHRKSAAQHPGHTDLILRSALLRASRRMAASPPVASIL